MAMTVQTNMSAVTALKHLNNSQDQMNGQLEKLSSGYRINSAADDAAGYAISSKMEGDKGKLMAAQENTFSAQSMVKMADAALNEITNITQRLQVLATKAASEQNSSTEQANLDKEAQKLLSVMDKIANSTRFNGSQLINAAATKTIQVGAKNNANDQLKINFTDNQAAALQIAHGAGTAVAAGTGGGGKIDLSTTANAQTSLTNLDSALSTLADNRAALGAANNQLAYASANLGTSIEQTSNSISAIKDTDMASAMADFTKSKIMVQAGTAMLSQANQNSQNILSLFR